jgi:hypothetical protein
MQGYVGIVRIRDDRVTGCPMGKKTFFYRNYGIAEIIDINALRRAEEKLILEWIDGLEVESGKLYGNV